MVEVKRLECTRSAFGKEGKGKASQTSGMAFKQAVSTSTCDGLVRNLYRH